MKTLKTILIMMLAFLMLPFIAIGGLVGLICMSTYAGWHYVTGDGDDNFFDWLLKK